MCLLVVQPKGAKLTRAEVNTYHDANPDGFGAAFGDGSKLHMVKLVGTAKDAWRAYRSTFAGHEALLHWRWATHGSKSRENAHPFLITDRLAVAHNGVLSTGNDADVSKTDTECLVDLVLRPMVESRGELYLFEPAVIAALGDLIGRGNKLGLVHASGRTAIVNASAGKMLGEWWYSNTSFGAQSRYSSYGGYSSVYGSTQTDDLWGRSYSTTPSGARIYSGSSARSTGRELVKVTPLDATGERVEREPMLKPEDFLDAEGVTLFHMRDAVRLGSAAASAWARKYQDAVVEAIVSQLDVVPSVVRGALAPGQPNASLMVLLESAVKASTEWLDDLHEMARGELNDIPDAGSLDACAEGSACMGCTVCADTCGLRSSR